MKQKFRSTKRTVESFRLRDNPLPLIRELVDRLDDSPRNAYLKREYLSKYVDEGTDPPSVRRQRAIFKWLCVESNNLSTNERLLTTDPEFQILNRVTFETFIGRVRSIVRDVLGDTVPWEALNGSFSGGASTSRTRLESHPALKFVGEAHVTSRAKDIFLDHWGNHLLWLKNETLSLTEVKGNVLFTVPKNTTIDRCACKEPDINMFLQKGIGDFIRYRLLGKGINLNDQSRNQNLARKGSLDGSLATLDLSSASDSLCREFVALALPECWFTYLDALRSPITIIDGEEHVNEMFSSMGNGFTFELESLLFYAVARAVAWSMNVPGVISVYGDDIICPTDIYHDLIDALGYLGFEINKEKSFATGSFRESCGGHYISGQDVTPFYIRAPINDVPKLLVFLNAVTLWSLRGPMTGAFLDPDLEELWTELAKLVPLCFWGGHDLNDNTRLVSLWKPSRPRRLGKEVRYVKTGLGGYLLWQCLGGAPVSLETRSVETGRYEVSRVRWDARWIDVAFAGDYFRTRSPTDVT